MSGFRNRLLKSALSNVLPIGFTRLDYIETSGKQYIDTGFKAKYNSRVVMDIEGWGTSLSWIFGAKNANSSTASDQFGVFRNTATSIRTDYFGSNKTLSISDASARTTVDKDGNVTTMYGSSLTNTSVSTGSGEYNLTLFCLNNFGTVQDFATIKCYSCRIYDNGVMVRDYIPASDESGNEGMYDVVNKTFYPLQTYFKPVVYDIPFDGYGHSMTLEAGTYKLQCWGAQGGVYSSSTMNRGGYSEGVLVLTESAEITINPGEQPASVKSGSPGDFVYGGGVGGYLGFPNGSGGDSHIVIEMYGQGGGGASSICFGKYNNRDLNYAVIVAGAGAGAAGTSTLYEIHGGGLTGGGGLHGDCGGTQINGGTCDVPGRFGEGIDGGYYISSAVFDNVDYISSGAGGGWYGGGSNSDYMDFQGGSPTAMYDCGGGSGFVLTEETFVNVPSTYQLTSKYFLKNAKTIGGNTNITEPNGSTMKGHVGHGYVRITRTA